MIYNKPKDVSFPFSGGDKPPRGSKKQQKVTKQNANKPPREDRTPLVSPNSNGFLARPAKARIALFLLVLYAGAVLSLIMPLRPSYSDIEKRSLKSFPQFSVKALQSGSYFDDISLWFSDTFPFRENLTKFSTDLKTLCGFHSVEIHGDIGNADEIPDVPLEITTVPDTTAPDTSVSVPQTEAPTEVQTAPSEKTSEKPAQSTKPAVQVQTLDGILIAGNAGYEYYNFSKTLAPKFIGLVSSIKKMSAGKANVYALIAPTGIDVVLDDATRKSISSSDQKKALDYFNASLRNAKAVTGVFETLRAHNSEYLYFRTDHHWTALGAYYGYTRFAEAKGITPIPLSQYESVSYKGFLGSFYSNTLSPALGKKPDTIRAYLPYNNISFHFTQSDGQTLSWPVINNVNEYNAGSKYCTFIAGDQPYEIIKNADLPEGESCLVIKESYGNAFVPFLIPHYKTIHVIDPRHYNGTLSGFLKEHPVDDILFIANISTTRNSVYIDAMANFIK